jgi:hypothetical protein
MARETGPINKRLSSLQGQGGDYETEIRYMGVARAILGGLKERLRMGNINVGAIRQVLPDGTEIIARTVLGAGGMADVDSVFINQPVPVQEILLPTEKEKISSKPLPRLLFGERQNGHIYSLNLDNYDITEEFHATDDHPSGLAAGKSSFCMNYKEGQKLTFFTRDWQLIKRISLPLLPTTFGPSPDYPHDVAYANGRYYVALRAGGNYADGQSDFRFHIKVYDEAGNELSDTFYAEDAWPGEICRNADDPEDETLYGLVAPGTWVYDPTHKYSGAAKVNAYGGEFEVQQSIPLAGTFAYGFAVSDGHFFTSLHGPSNDPEPNPYSVYKYDRLGKLLATQTISGGFSPTLVGLHRFMAWIDGRLFLYGARTVGFQYLPTIFIFDEALNQLPNIELSLDLISSPGWFCVDFYAGDAAYSIEPDLS